MEQTESVVNWPVSHTSQFGLTLFIPPAAYSMLPSVTNHSTLYSCSLAHCPERGLGEVIGWHDDVVCVGGATPREDGYG